MVLASKPLADGFRVWASKPGWSFAGTRDDTWCHREPYVEAEQSCEEPVVIGCLHLKLDYFAPGLSGSAKISKSVLGMCNSSINKVEAAPNQPSL